MEDGQVSYEVPFGVLNVGKDEIEGAAGERYITPCKDVHPRAIENWIGAGNEHFGVTLSSSVAVADYIDPTAGAEKNQILQPILLASRRSCHGEGNEYLQTGDHHFEFSFTSHMPDHANSHRFGRQANEKLLTVVNPPSYRNANLAEEMAFFEVNKDNLIISTIKKAEDDNGFMVRVYNIAGKAVQMRLRGFIPFQFANRANMIEEIGESATMNNGEMEFEIGKYSIETFILNAE
jgi:alpha-mannosidase